MFSERAQKWVLYLLRATLAIALAGAIFELRWTVAFVTVLTLLLTFLPYVFTRRYSIVLPLEFVLATVFFIYATLFLGEVHGFYEQFWWWDVVLHSGSALGFGMIGFTILYVLHRAGKLDARPGLIAVFSFAFAVAIGALWEVFEFAADQILGTNMQKSGLVDTMWDSIANSVGALVAAIGGYFYLAGKKNIVGRTADAFVRKNKKLVRGRQDRT